MAASVVIAVLALVPSAFNAYTTWLEKARLEALPSAATELSSDRDQPGGWRTLRVQFREPTGKLVTLHHVELGCARSLDPGWTMSGTSSGAAATSLSVH